MVKITRTVMFGGLVLLQALRGAAALVAYEGFNYPATNRLNGLNGSFGWSAGWVDGAANRYGIASQTLERAGLFSFGNTAQGLTNLANMSGYRRVAAPGGGWMGGAFSTNWLAFLVQYRAPLEALTGAVSSTLVLALTNDAFATRKWYFGAQGNLFTNAAGLPTWGVRYYQNLAVANTGVPVVSGQTEHVVVRLAQGAADTQVALWLNPALDHEPALSNAVVATRPDIVPWDVVLMAYGSVRCACDEVRLGECWADMTNVPLVADQPVNLAPAPAATQVALPVTLTASAFSSSYPGDTQAESQFTLSTLDGVSMTITTGAVTSISVAGLAGNTRYTWQVRYKGSLSGSWSAWSAATWFDSAGPALGLLAYDGAAYAPTNSVAGLAGGLGWAGDWVSENATGTNIPAVAGVTSPGLYYSNVASTGNTFTADNPQALRSVGARRQLAHDGAAPLLNADGAFGKPGTTNWFSIMATSPDSANGGYGVGARPLLSASLNRLYFGKSPYGRAWYAATMSRNTLQTFTEGFDTVPVFLLCRAVHGLSSSDTAVHVWVNPATDSEPDPASAALSITNSASFVFGALRIGTEAKDATVVAPLASLDELRFGATYAAVVPTLSIPNQPANLTPTNAELTGFTVTLQASAFSSSVPGDTHLGSDFAVWRGTTPAFATNIPQAVTSWSVPAGVVRSDTRYTWNVRYYGIAGVPSAWSASTSFAVQNTNAPRLLAYDGAGYPVTNSIGGLAGGSGWNGGWTALAGEETNALSKYAVMADGLTYDPLLVEGGCFASDSSLRTADAARRISDDGRAHLTTPAGAFGQPGTTNWFAFLARHDSGLGGYRLHLNAGSAAPYYYQAVLSFGTAFSTPQWTLAAAGQSVTASQPDPLSNATYFVVARVVFGLAPDSTEAHVWIDPALASEPDPGAATLALAAVSNFTYTLVGIYAAPPVGGVTAPPISLDEIKCAESWQNLAETPEPAGMALLLAIVVLQCIGRRT